jgi:4-amino-4-deoxy-L-arabinose transferase-like glycosyltransferase
MRLAGVPRSPEVHQKVEADLKSPRVRSPSALLVFLGSLTAASLLRAFTFSTSGLSWDESLYIVMAQRWLQGDLPYVAVWDQHPVGLPALLAIAQLMVSDGLLAARLLALLAVSGTAALLYQILDRRAGERSAGILAASLYLLYMTRPDGLVANTEVFNNFVTTGAAALLLSETARPTQALSVGGVFLAALLLGVGLQIKYVILPESLFFCCLALALMWLRGAGISRTAGLGGVMVLGGALPTAVATLYFWQKGALQPYIEANVSANVAYIRVSIGWQTALAYLRDGLRGIAPLLPWPVVLAILLRDIRFSRQRRLALWLVVWLVAAAIDVTMPLKFWRHYFNALLPPLSLTAGLAATLLARRFTLRKTIFSLIAAATAIPAVLVMVRNAPISRSIDRINVPRAVAARIQQVGTNLHDVFVFNYDPLVYNFAGASPPTRFVFCAELTDFASSSGAQPLQEVAAVLAQNPAWIVIAEPSPYKFTPAVLGRLHGALRDYKLDSSWRDQDYSLPPFEVRLYRRIGIQVRQDANALDRG